MAKRSTSAPPSSRQFKQAMTHLALLRGINVGGKNKLVMADLTAIFERAGCQNVRTYIQSGNVIFCASADRATSISAEISAAVLKSFGLRVPVVIRSRDEMAKVVKRNPFLRLKVDADWLHVVFLADEPARAILAALDSERSPGDTFVARGREIYLHLPNGAARSKLTAAYFDATLNTISTQRNWRTVMTLLEMMQQ